MATASPLAQRVGGARSAATARTKRGVLWGLAYGIPRVALTVTSRQGDPQGVLTMRAPEGSDLVGFLEDIRRDGPLKRTQIGLITVDHAAAKEILAHPHFAAGPPTLGGWLDRTIDWARTDALHPLVPPSLLVTEPPEHTRYRKLVTRVFTHRAVEALRTEVQEIADGLLDDLARRPAGTSVDLISTYAAQLPVTVICRILGVDFADRERVLRYGAAAAPALDLALPWRAFRDVQDGLLKFDTWLGEHLDHLRRHPGDDLLSQLVHIEDEGVRLTDRELRSTAGLVLAAGFETTVNLIGNGIALLRENPDELAVLRDQPDLWANTAEEALRLDPPVLLTGRLSQQDVVVAGQHLPRGTFITLLIAGANRDPAVFPDPDRFDVTRPNAREHLAFGHGRHHCLGASLARMEGTIGLRSLFERFPDLALQPGAKRRPTRILRGYATLPAVLTTRS